MDLSEISNDELRKEIERRKIALTKPQMRVWTSVDTNKLKELCQDYIDSLAGDCRFKDPEHIICEAAIELFFGEDVWGWINERIE